MIEYLIVGMVNDGSKLCRTKRSGGPLLMTIEAFDIVDDTAPQVWGEVQARRLVSHLPEEVLVCVCDDAETKKTRVKRRMAKVRVLCTV